MDIMELGAIGELVGGVAVIASLLFVGLQVRQSARAQNNAAVDAAINSMMGLNTSLAGDAELTRIVNDASLDREGIDTPEYVRFHLIMRGVFVQFDSVRVKREAGMVHDSLWHTEESFLSGMLATPGISKWWKRNSKDFSPAMRSHVAHMLSTSDRKED